jgi:hypothetical protein
LKIDTLQHPDTHHAAIPWSEDQTLHVVSAYSNPFRWRNRREIANDFIRHMQTLPNVKLHMVELAYGDRPFEVTTGTLGSGDVQLRTQHELFHKENLLNLGVRTLPPDAKYIAISDADFHYTRHDWALEVIHQLQMYHFVQTFSSYTNLSGEMLGDGHRMTGGSNSFMYNYIKRGYQLPSGFSEGGWRTPYSGGVGNRDVGAPGGGWAFRRSAFDAVGGLLDRCILGSADWFMAFGLIGNVGHYKFVDGYTDDYRNFIRAWQDRAATLHKNVGYVDCHAIHHFHGPKHLRAYSTRDAILVNNKYSPVTDVYPDWQGVLQLAPHKSQLRDEVRRYFISRCEDKHHE